MTTKNEAPPAPVDWANLTLDQALDIEAEGWNPEPGDKIIGTVIAVSSAVSEYTGEPYPVYTVVTRDGEPVKLFGFHHVFKGRLPNAEPGDVIGLKYKGKRESKSTVGGKPREYADYNGFVIRNGTPAHRAALQQGTIMALPALESGLDGPPV